MGEGIALAKKKKVAAPPDAIELISQEVRCGICLRLAVDPSLLPCAHSFCTGCLVSWHRYVRREKKKRLNKRKRKEKQKLMRERDLLLSTDADNIHP
jgi:hypothetical protein